MDYKVHTSYEDGDVIPTDAPSIDEIVKSCMQIYKYHNEDKSIEENALEIMNLQPKPIGKWRKYLKSKAQLKSKQKAENAKVKENGG